MFYGTFVGVAPTKLLRHNKSTLFGANHQNHRLEDIE